MPTKPTDADLMVGGPGPDANAPAPVATPPAAPAAAVPANATERVSIAGQVYEVPSDLASAFRRERDRIAGEYGSRLEQERRRLAAEREEPEDEPETQGVRPPNARDLIDDPEKYHRDNQAWTQHLVAEAAQGVEQRRLQERQAEVAETARTSEWNRQVAKFYTDYPELRGDEDIVDSCWQRNFGRLKELNVEEGFKELARISRERILAAGEKGKALRSKAPTLETSASSRAPRQPSQTPVEDAPTPGGVGAAIRAKQRRFRMPFPASGGRNS